MRLSTRQLNHQDDENANSTIGTFHNIMIFYFAIPPFSQEFFSFKFLNDVTMQCPPEALN